MVALIDRLPHRLLSLGLAVLLASCASYSGRGLVVGQSELSEVTRIMGEPRQQWNDPDGSRLLAYPRGPMGTHTYLLRIGQDGKLTSLENVLSAAGFQRITAGMSREQVLRTLGPPEPTWTVYFKARDELVWEWRYCDDLNQLARFDVLFDGSKDIVRSTLGRREECGPTGVCWCSH